ncbi:MAG: YhcH/YjgK/YiaL family protein [Nitrospinae bacterium]|nr:YhcH/YjgK/YiaL family protein [Nitrospinota bacterium]
MIFGQLDRVEKGSPMPDERLRGGFLFLLSADLILLPEGKHDIGGGMRAIVETYPTAPANSKRFEAHRDNIDIQLVVTGLERMDCAFTNTLSISQKYDPSRDVMFFEPPGIYTSISVVPGNFAVFYPSDAHRPGVILGDSPARVKKVVIKVPAGG